MKKNYVKSLKCYFLSMLTVGAMGLTKLAPVKAEEVTVTQEPAVIESLESRYNLDKKSLKKDKQWKKIILELFKEYPAVHIMQQDENLSSISKEVVSKQLGAQTTSKYWVVEAYLSGYPKIGKPGDPVYFIDSLEGMEIALTILKRVGWYANYVQNNGIYNDTEVNLTISELVKAVYGIDDPELVILFLAAKGLLCEYDGNTIIKPGMFEGIPLTEYIPTLEELGYQVKQY